jgi:hypothetical protein
MIMRTKGARSSFTVYYRVRTAIIVMGIFSREKEQEEMRIFRGIFII